MTDEKEKSDDKKIRIEYQIAMMETINEFIEENRDEIVKRTYVKLQLKDKQNEEVP